MNILQTIGAWIASAGIFIGSLLGYQPLGNLPQATALFETSLQAPITSSDTTATLISGTTKDGNSLSGTYGFIIDEGTSKAEVVICSASGTALTACRRGISWDNGTSTVAANQKAHNKGATVKITDHPTLIQMDNILRGSAPIFAGNLYLAYATSVASSSALIDRLYLDTTSTNYVSVAGGQTITGAKVFTATSSFTKAPTSVTPIASDELATKGYVDGVAIAGSASSSESVFGFSKLSTAAVDANLPIAVGDNDTRLTYFTRFYGSNASSSTSTSLTGSDVWVNIQASTGATSPVNFYLCYKRDGLTYPNQTSTLATTVVSGTGAKAVSLTGIYVNPTSTTETVLFYMADDSNCLDTELGGFTAGTGRTTIIKFK